MNAAERRIANTC